MKLISLKFTNINSLRGTHEIRFDTQPLDKAGLFAILGPTGSGKSTILDVITLALFNRIPRFDKAISRNEIENLGSVVTLNTKSAAAEITYEIHGERYTSSWSIETTKTGNLKDYNMDLSNSKGSFLDLKKSEVPKKNEEIIGLAYEQFIKSIILSQGDFARFLRAKKNERGALLENITGTHIYRKLGIRAFEKSKAIKQELEQKNAIIQEIKVLSEEEREATKEILDKTEKQLKKLTSFIQAQEQVKAIKSKIEELNQEIAEENANWSKYKEKLAIFKPKQAALAVHHEIVQYSGDISLYRDAQAETQKAKANIQQHKTSLERSQTALAEAIKSMSNLTNKALTVDDFKQTMSEFERKINQMDGDLAHLKSKGKEQRERIKTQSQKIDTKAIDLKQGMAANAAIEALSSRKKELSNRLITNKIAPTKDIKEYETKIQDLRTKSLNAKEISYLLKQKKEQESEVIQIEEEQRTIEDWLERNTPLQAQRIRTIQAIKDTIQVLHQRKEDALKIASLEELRKKLEDNKPCPLCGSKEHPYTKHQPQEEQDQIELNLKNKEQELEEEEAALNKLNASITKGKTKAEDNKVHLKAIKPKILACEANLKPFYAENPEWERLDLASLLEKEQLLNQELGNLERGVTALKEIEVIDQLDLEYQELQKITEAYLKLDKNRKALYSGKNISEDCNQLQDDFTSAQTAIAGHQTAIELEQQSLANKNEKLLASQTVLNKLTTQLGFDSIETLNSKFLSDRLVKEYEQLATNLQKEETAITTKLETAKTTRTTYLQKDEDTSIDLKTVLETLEEAQTERNQLHQIIGEKTSILDQDKERIKRRAAQVKEIETLEKEDEKWSLLNKIIGDRTGNKFANFAQGITLENLMIKTNQRLLKLTDRYLLSKPRGGDTLKVVDLYQGNIERAVTTLSGGETFLISLALALSLSDMAAQNLPLDSLFIDEGFGTLDQESLDIALDTLERLQSESQKTVGVISHVEALKERINVQIKLHKNSQGYSTIEIES